MTVELEKKLQNLKNNNKKFFIPFITAGYPNLLITEKLILKIAECGADVIELGIPFSDPLADGPTIQHSSEIALRNGVSLSKILDLVQKIRAQVKIPIVFMCYYNLIYHYGVEKFAQIAREKGVDGLIVPDLPPEEADILIKAAKKNNLATIFLFAPTSSDERIKLITKKSSGFVYYVSLTGVTGERDTISDSIIPKINAARKFTNKPIAVGFGISTKEQAHDIALTADGVIVGSAIVKTITANIDKTEDELVNNVGFFVKEISDTIHSL